MKLEKLISLCAALMLFSLVVSAQEQTQKTIKHVPLSATSPSSGQDMYKAYCAVCHGTDGKGNGPAASALKTPPTDLTQLTKNNGGKFPDMKVASTVRGEGNIAAHGTPEMPIWGQLFWNMSHGHEGEVQQRVANLTKYVQSLQAK
jgi:mono/diheme cytochrome c family protein